MNLKELLKSNRAIRVLGKKYRIYRAFINDAVFFSKHYVDGPTSKNRLEYRILFLVHNIEKGMSRTEKRPFGKEKCLQIIELLQTYRASGYDCNSTAFQMGLSILKAWLDLWESIPWDPTEETLKVKEFISTYTKEGTQIKDYSGVEKSDHHGNTGSYADIVTRRKSIRLFSDQPLLNNDITSAVLLAMRAPSACNRQMCKIYQVAGEDKKKYLYSIIQGIPGFDYNTLSFFLITYDSTSLFSSGERNQGYFNAGLLCMSLVNAFEYKGIGSCILQWGNDIKQEAHAKRILSIPEDERIAAIIAAGYYPDEFTVPRSHRKTIDEYFTII